MTLWLVGMMGSGKSSAGALAAENLGVPFHDTDNEIAGRMGCSVAQLWGDLGESAFRDMERATIQRLAGTESVVGTGGGAILDEANRRTMHESGKVVWLTAPSPTLAKRVGSGPERPLLAKDSDVAGNVASILKEREPAYADSADERIDTESRTVEEVAEKIAEAWPH
jgi:shikimate kinase